MRPCYNKWLLVLRTLVLLWWYGGVVQSGGVICNVEGVGCKRYLWCWRWRWGWEEEDLSLLLLLLFGVVSATFVLPLPRPCTNSSLPFERTSLLILDG